MKAILNAIREIPFSSKIVIRDGYFQNNSAVYSVWVFCFGFGFVLHVDMAF